MAGRWKPILLAGGIVVLTVAAYIPALRAGYIWDDDVYLTNNSEVLAAGQFHRIWWGTQTEQYYPLTVSSFWLEYRIWGDWPAGYHLTNILLHAAGSVLLWRLLLRLGVPGAWLAGLLFAVHPVNVASVAWISERKNTLSLLFAMLAGLWYLRFNESAEQRACQRLAAKRGETGLPTFADSDNPTSEIRNPKSLAPASPSPRVTASAWYILSLAAFALALLSKTAVAPLPLALLLCIWWRRKLCARDLWQTAPLFALAAGMVALTIHFEQTRALVGQSILPPGFSVRLVGAGWAVWFYLFKAIWPARLLMVYPRWDPNTASLGVFVPFVLLLGVGAILWHNRRGWARPLVFGLGAHLAMLLPALGLVPFAFLKHSMVADHFQYVPLIGVVALVAGTAARAAVFVRGRLKARSPTGQTVAKALPALVVLVASVPVLVPLMTLTFRRARSFESHKTLWADNLSQNPSSWIAHYILGTSLLKEGKQDEAVSNFLECVRINPRFMPAYNELSAALADQGRWDMAMTQLAYALRIGPDSSSTRLALASLFMKRGKFIEAAEQYQEIIQLKVNLAAAYDGLGTALACQGETQRAIDCYNQAIALNKRWDIPHFNLGNLYLKMGRRLEAAQEYRQALRLDPTNSLAHHNLALLLLDDGQTREALVHLARQVELSPADPKARYTYTRTLANYLWSQLQSQAQPDSATLARLAWILATDRDAAIRDSTRAVMLAERANELTEGRDPVVLDTLAAAYAAAKRFGLAVQTAEAAANRATQAGQHDLAAKTRARLALYRAAQDYRE